MTDPSVAPLRLTGTRIAEFFRYGCERQLRYDLSPMAQRPARPRPGSGLLTQAGRQWERRKLQQLLGRYPGEHVLIEGRTEKGYPKRLPAATVVEVLRDPGEIEILVQPQLRLPDPDSFARRYGLVPGRIEFAAAVPDIIRLRRLRDGTRSFQVVDIKAAAAARVPHFAQVAFYTLLLEEICRTENVQGGAPDLRWGRVWARDGRGPRRFALGAYRHHLEHFLRRDLPRIAAQAPEESAWHLATGCGGCPYLSHCRDEADRADDLARIVGISPLAKERLRERGIRTVKELANSFRRDTYTGCHALEASAVRLKQRAQAMRFGKVFDVEARTHLMAPHEDVRVILTAEADPVTNTCFALGLRVDGGMSAAFLSEAGTAAAEREMLAAFLARLDRLLADLDRQNRKATEPQAKHQERGKRGRSAHLYVWDRAELDLLQALLERHLADVEIQASVSRLLSALSPGTTVAALNVLRSSPGTVLSDVVAALFALPVPYAYDLASVSASLVPSERAWMHRPRTDYSWPLSSQVAFERVHNVWRSRPHGTEGGTQTPEEVAAEIRRTVQSKLSAIDSVLRAVRERSARRRKLQMQKEPFLLGDDDGPIGHPALETLRIFARMESVAEAVSTRALHVLPSEERARRFECIRAMEFVERREDGALVFEFDPECRDAKFRAGDFNLVLTNDDGETLLETDRHPWKRRKLMVELVEYDLAASPPRVVLAPGSGFEKAEAEGLIHLDRQCVLDRAPSDFNTRRIVSTLRHLGEGRGEARFVTGLFAGEVPAGWNAGYGCAEEVFREVIGKAAEAYRRPALNPDQERAWRAALQECVTLVWGPPGTGKTYLLAWTLIGLAAAARREGRPCRILVTAATHRATVNVLSRFAAELEATGIPSPLRAVKLRGSGSEAHADLEGSCVEVVPDTRLARLLEASDDEGQPLVVGSTVWSLWKQMKAAQSEDEEENPDAPIQPYFDVVVIDEASQMKVSEALIALSAIRPGGQVILCGDDKQLAPVIRGRYAADAGTLFGSVFSHYAGHFEKRILRESRRMNRALVEYPREIHYPGLVSMVPEQRVALGDTDGSPGDSVDALLREVFLAPEDAIILCTYDGITATARNPFEAHLVARLAKLARESLIDPGTGEVYTPKGFVSDALAVISPHRAQNSAIFAELQRLGMAPGELPVVDTVERMQGNEREVILVSYGVADREYAEAEAEFLLSPNRFNVSITRARAKLVLFVSEEVLRAFPTDEAVLTGSMAIKGYREHCGDGVREVELPGPDGAPIRVRCHYKKLVAGAGAAK